MKIVRYFFALLTLATLFSLPISATHTGNQALLDAVLRNNTQEVQRLLTSGTVDINYQGNDCEVSLDVFFNFKSVLHLATFLQNTNLVKILLEAGANPNICDECNHNKTPLHALSFIKNADVYTLFTLLVKAGANVNAQDDFQQTPLHMAVERKNHTFAHLLLTTPGLDKTLTDCDNKTALDHVHSHCAITQAEKQKLINLFIFDTVTLKETLTKYIKAHPEQFNADQLAQLPVELRPF